MKASFQKDTESRISQQQVGRRSPVLSRDGDQRFVKRGESRECFYFGVARKLIGDKWSLLILFILRDGSMRFNALLRGVEGISQKILTANLRELERDGYLKREVINTSPPSVEYSLSEMGADFLTMMDAVSGWVENNWQNMEESRKVFDQKVQDLECSDLED